MALALVDFIDSWMVNWQLEIWLF